MDVLERLPIYQLLGADDRRELQGHIQVFMAEKRFEGCAGLELTDRIRVTIAANACVLLLHRETDYYPNCTSILVYPQEYFATGRQAGAGGMVLETVQRRAGESWMGAFAAASGGPIVLSWRAVEHGAHCPNDGQNVVFHEFAHQLDSESGAMDGAPLLERHSKYIAWARVLGSEFEQLNALARRGVPTLIHPYGTTNPAEFFAVCTEVFFERGREMRMMHPALYAQLADYYQQDPAAWAQLPASPREIAMSVRLETPVTC
jgi:Mlc titration factor MtfA (ptsG expression regulator)